VRKCEIPIPPFAEQQRIVGILDDAFVGIATAKANTTKNLQNARALFESRLQAVFTRRGEGWVEKPLLNVCLKVTDGEHLRPRVTRSGVPFLSAKDVLDNDVIFSDCLYVSEEDAKKFRKRCDPGSGDILIVSRGATVGRTCIVKTERVFCLLGSVILLKIGSSVLSPFITYYLKSPLVRQNLMHLSEAAAQQAIYLRDIRRLNIAFPTITDQRRIIDILDRLFIETERLASLYQRKLAALEALKKSLLHQAFTGNL
jgi:type I restriction enzyme S subunit